MFFVREEETKVGNPQEVEDSEEYFVPVSYEEASGIGFYRYHIRDDIRHITLEEGDLRY